jgi:hypothetical protein
VSTPNAPAPGSPAWLREEANHRECRGDPQEIPAGLRAAAERIEQLMRKIQQQEAWWAELQELRASESNYIREMREEAAITLEQARRYRYLQPEHGLMTALAERLEHYARKLEAMPRTNLPYETQNQNRTPSDHTGNRAGDAQPQRSQSTTEAADRRQIRRIAPLRCVAD